MEKSKSTDVDLAGEKEVLLPSQAPKLTKCDPKVTLAKSLVTFDTIPNALLSLTLIEEVCEDWGWDWWSLLPGLVSSGLTFFAVYSLFTPYMISSILSLSLGMEMFYVFAPDRVLLNVITVLLIGLLTLNATYVFSGMNLEGFDKTSDMFDDFSDRTDGELSSFFDAFSDFFDSVILDWISTLINIPVTFLTFSAVHKNFLIDRPRNLYLQATEDQKIYKKRKSLLSCLQAYEHQLLDLQESEATSSDLVPEITEGLIVDSLGVTVDNFSSFIQWEEKDNNESFQSQLLSRAWQAAVLVIFFLGTYCMNGNAVMTGRLLKLGDIDPTLASVMSAGTRVTITGIWFESAYRSFSNIVNLLGNFLRCRERQGLRVLGLRVDDNWTRVKLFFLSGLAGFFSSLTLVHSVKIGLDLEDMSLTSIKGIIYLITASFGPTIGDGTPTFDNLMGSHIAKVKKELETEDNPSRNMRLKLYLVGKSLGELKKKIIAADAKTIDAVPYSLIMNK